MVKGGEFEVEGPVQVSIRRMWEIMGLSGGIKGVDKRQDSMVSHCLGNGVEMRMVGKIIVMNMWCNSGERKIVVKYMRSGLVLL